MSQEYEIFGRAMLSSTMMRLFESKTNISFVRNRNTCKYEDSL